MDALFTYLENRENAINNILKKPNKDYTPDIFRLLRIEIKKLDAFFDLVKFCSKGFNRDKTFKPFKKLFLQAGKIRELQLEEEIINTYFLDDILTDYRDRLIKQQLREQIKFYSLVNKKIITKFNKKYIEILPYLSSFDINKGKIYFKKKENTIKKHFNNSPLKVKKAHDLRRQLKMFKYDIKILSMKEQNISHIDTNNLSLLLGEWHDHEVIVKHLKRIMYFGHIHRKELKELKLVKEKISINCDMLFDEINSLIINYSLWQPPKMKQENHLHVTPLISTE